MTCLFCAAAGTFKHSLLHSNGQTLDAKQEITNKVIPEQSLKPLPHKAIHQRSTGYRLPVECQQLERQHTSSGLTRYRRGGVSTASIQKRPMYCWDCPQTGVSVASICSASSHWLHILQCSHNSLQNKHHRVVTHNYWQHVSSLHRATFWKITPIWAFFSAFIHLLQQVK